MSTIPSRTRSIRKPAEPGNNRYGRPSAPESGENSVRQVESKSIDRSSQSPSRLPVKHSTRNPATTSSRPPSSAGSAIGNSSTRPSSSRANIGRPTTAAVQISSSNRVSIASAGTERIEQDRSRPPVTTSRHIRNLSASVISTSTRVPSHARTGSTSTILSASTILRPPTREGAAPRSAHAESQLRRPAFSTLQQHFSPAKSLAPKPHPAAFLAPPSPSKLPSNVAISAEIAKLQNELLQLHLLHKGTTQVEKEWRASAKRKLGARFQSVVKKNNELVDLETEETGKINAAALQKWQDLGTPGWGLEEKIQVLDEVLAGIWNLGESGGKYSKIVRKFERWLSRCQHVLETRSRDDNLENDEVMFLEVLDAGWKEDCHVLGRKLETWRSHLNDLGSPDGGSSLASIVGGCRSLIRGILTELSVMQQIERDAMSMEVGWIKTMNDDLDDDENIPNVGAAWRLQ